MKARTCFSFLAALALAACSSEAASPLSPGVSGGPLGSTLEIVTVDAVTFERTDAPSVDVSDPSGASLSLMGPASDFFAEGVSLASPIHVRVGLTSWGPIEGSRVVLPVGVEPAPTRAMIEVRGLPPGTADVQLDAIRPARLVSASPLAAGTRSPSSPMGEGVHRAELMTPPGAGDRVVAVARDAAGAVIGIALATLDGAVLDVGSRLLDTATIAVSWPTPPVGAAAVIGVPGIALGERFAVLPQDGSGSVVVPRPESVGDDARIWLVAETTLADGSRSVVLQRGIATLETPSVFPDYLPGVAASVIGGSVEVGPVPGATLLVVELIDGSGATVGRSWAFASSGSFPVPPEAMRARVRAFDVPIDTSAFDVRVLDASLLRWSERELDAVR